MGADEAQGALHAYGEHPDQVIEHFPADAPNGRTEVVVHGGFWRPRYDRSHARPQARALAELGYDTWLPEYRRMPGDPSASIGDLLEALAAAHLATPILIGHSAGGQLALIAGLRSAPAGVISLGGVVDLERADALGLGEGAVRAFLGTAAVNRPDLDPVQCTPPGFPVELVHGTEDADVPAELSERLASAWGCGLTILPRVGHMPLIEPDRAAWARVIAILARIANIA